VPTFLEYLWASLYAADCERRFANYSARGIEIADMTAEQIAAICSEAQAFADAMVTGTTPASTAALETAIAALKSP
jgi:hypothetical protein